MPASAAHDARKECRLVAATDALLLDLARVPSGRAASRTDWKLDHLAIPGSN
jgi:hypothetical protein